MKSILTILISIFALTTSLSAQNISDYIDDASIMANIKSIFSNGDVACELLLYLDVSDKNDLPEIKFQVGNFQDPSAYLNESIDVSTPENTLAVESVRTNGNMIEYNFGKIKMNKDYSARLFIKDGYYIMTHDLPLTNYSDQKTNMN